MSGITRLAAALACATAGAGAILTTAVPAQASTAGQLVFVVKDQAGGAFWNVTTGARYDLVAASAAPTLGIAAVQAADGTILAADGEVLAPFGSTPLDSEVAVVEAQANGTLVDTSTAAEYDLAQVSPQMQSEYTLALKLTTGAILTINNHVLLPVQQATGLTYG